MSLRELCIEDMEPIRKARNESVATLRTTFPLTKEQQKQWYRDEICNRSSRSRFWAVTRDDTLVGYGGIENIQWENSIGEISLLIFPEHRGKHIGFGAARNIIGYAAGALNLHTIYGEVYCNNPAIGFWVKVVAEYNGYSCTLPKRKYLGGAYHDSMYFSVSL